MLAYIKVLLANSHGKESIVIPGECCETVVVPMVSHQKVWVTMIGLAFTSTNHVSFIGMPPPHPPSNLACAEMIVNFWVMLAPNGNMEGVVMP